MAACDSCIRRTWLLQRLGGYLDFQRKRVEVILGFEDRMLLDCWLGTAERKGWSGDLCGEYECFDAEAAELTRERVADAGLEQMCMCQSAYPERLRRLFTPPAVLHVAGGMQRFLELADGDPVAIVGTRRPTIYGTEVARVLGRGVSISGLSVVSGMAMGIDAAAHAGALAGGGRTIAVLPGSAAEPYPKTNQRLYGQILRSGVAVSELGFDAPTRKWSLIARNRIIAALSELTIVVQGKRRSGALTTAEFARGVGCRLGAVPGPVLAPQSEGPHELLRTGAAFIRDVQDILDAVCGVGERTMFESERSGLTGMQREVFDAIRGGVDTVAALDRSRVGGGQLLMLLAELEISGCVRRIAGGRYVVSL